MSIFISIVSPLWRVADWLTRQWFGFCIKGPLHIWRRIWGLKRRSQFLSASVVAVLLVVGPPLFFEYLVAVRPEPTPTSRLAFRMAEALYNAEHAALAWASGGIRSLALPQPIAAHSPLELASRTLAVILVVSLALPFAVVLVMGGPVLVPVVALTGPVTPDPVVCGRRVCRGPRLLPRWAALSWADHKGEWLVGRSETGRGPLFIDVAARVMHTWIFGKTGTGKTQVLLSLLRADILAGRPIVFIDGKGDRETLSALMHFLREAGRVPQFRYLDPRRPAASCTYSPFRTGSPNEQTDKIMAALKWDSEYYRSQSRLVLLRVLRALHASKRPFTLEDLFLALSNLDALRALAQVVPEHQRISELEPIATRWKEYQAETSGMRSQLDALLMTDFGELLCDPEPMLDFAEVQQKCLVVYVPVPISQLPETGPLLAKLMIGDLNSLAGLIQDGQLEKRFMSVVIDEFAAFAMPSFVDLLNKARSAAIGITFSHQSMRGDLASAAEGYVSQLVDNTNVKICCRQTDDAEYIASLFGTRPTTRLTQQTRAAFFGEEATGLGSERDAAEYQVSPNVVRRLPRGMAIVSIDQPEPYLDLVALDYVGPDNVPPYEPPMLPRKPSKGLNLRALVYRTPARAIVPFKRRRR